MGAGSPEDIDRLFSERMAVGDVDGVVALYEPGGGLVSYDGLVTTGAAAIREALARLAAMRPLTFGYGVTGHLYYPNNTPEGTRLPAVIWLHGYSYPLGYMWVYRSDPHPILALVNAGYAVLAFDQIGFGSRMGEFAPFYKRHPHWSLMGRMVEDTTRAVDALSADPAIDPSRISVFGYTIGGTVRDAQSQGISQVTMSLTGSQSGSTSTSGSGRYSRDSFLCRARHKHVNAEFLIMPSEAGERAAGAGFMQFYSALSERRQKGEHIVLRLESRHLRTCWRQFAERSFLRL